MKLKWYVFYAITVIPYMSIFYITFNFISETLGYALGCMGIAGFCYLLANNMEEKYK